MCNVTSGLFRVSNVTITMSLSAIQNILRAQPCKYNNALFVLFHYIQDVPANITKYPTVFMQSVRNFCKILTKFEFSQNIFVPVIKIKFHGNPSRGNCANSCGQTDITKLRGAVCDYANSNKHAGLSAICVSDMIFMKYFEGVWFLG